MRMDLIAGLSVVAARDSHADFAPAHQFRESRKSVCHINRIPEVRYEDCGPELDRNPRRYRGQNHEYVSITEVIVDPDLIKLVLVRELGELDPLRDRVLIGDMHREL